MSWYHTFVLYLALVDSGAVLLGGLVAAFVILAGWDASKLWERVFPATATLIGTNIAAALMLGAAHWVIG